MSQGISERLSIACLRAAVRYAPAKSLRSWLWQRYVEPDLAWRDHPFVVDTAAGRMAGNTRDILQQYLYYFGIWEPEVTQFVQRRLRPGDVFIDVGANIGYFSLLGAKCVDSQGHVVAVEASPPIYGQLVANLKRNRTSNVSAFNVVAAGETGRAKLYSGQPYNCGATSSIVLGGEEEVAEVDAAPLTDLVQPEHWRRTRLVKIDVEGGELAVLRGLGDWFHDGCSLREYLVEVHPVLLESQGFTADDVLALFKSIGYQPYVIANDYEPASYLRRQRPRRPQRLATSIECDTNLIFSSEDRSEL